MSTRSTQHGVTLIELLIGMAVGLIVIGGALTIYLSTLRSSNDTLRASKLNQEIGSMLQVVANDVRRAGFWGNVDLDAVADNPFNQQNATALVVIDDMINNTVQPATGSGTCIVYAYDATYSPGNLAGIIEDTDLFGFRLNGTTVQMRQRGVVDGTSCIGGTCNSCTNGTWEDVTDPGLIEVTALTFDLGASQCLNAAEPNGVDDDADGVVDDDDEFDCYVTVPAVASDVATLESRELLVSATGRLAADPSTQVSVSQSIRIRNDLVRRR